MTYGSISFIVDKTGIGTLNRHKNENVGSELKSRRIKKDINTLKEKYSNIGDNEYFISNWGFTLEFHELK